MTRNALVLDLVSLTPELLSRADAPNLRRLAREGRAVDVEPPFPALTCTAQATLTTGASPRVHGVVGNGWFDRATHDIGFWEQPAALAQSPRVWDRLKRVDPDAKTAMMFFQQSMYAPGLDVVMSPRPIHLETGMVQWVYSKPKGLYEGLVPEVGAFDLKDYWGPFASLKSSEWIVDAASRVLAEERPRLSFLYLPHLDYNALRHGPSSDAAREDVRALDTLVGRLLDNLERDDVLEDTAIVALGEYAFHDVDRPVHLNRVLRDAGLLEVREIDGHEYLDTELSAAFAVTDHQVAHVYVQDEAKLDEARDALTGVPGVDRVLDADGKRALEVDHPRAGDLVAIAEKNAWFQYYYWEDDAKAPPFAHTVDIHRKCGFDVAELFGDPVKKSIPLDASLVGGSHGRPATTPEERVSLVVNGADADISGARTLADLPDVLLEIVAGPEAAGRARTLLPEGPA